MTQIGSEYIERYPEWRESLPGKDLAWLTEMRADAFEHFAERGFPTHTYTRGDRYKSGTSASRIVSMDNHLFAMCADGSEPRQRASRCSGTGYHQLPMAQF